MEQRRFLAARIDHWARSRSMLLDRLVAGSMWVLFGTWSALVAGSVGFLLATATVLPLAVRRRWPTVVLAWSVAMFAVQLVVVPIPLPANITQALVIATVATHVASLPVRLCALGAGVVGSLLGGFRWSTPPAYLANAVGTGLFLAVLVVLICSLTVVVVQADGAGYAAEHAQPARTSHSATRAVASEIATTSTTKTADAVRSGSFANTGGPAFDQVVRPASTTAHPPPSTHDRNLGGAPAGSLRPQC